MRAGQSGRCSDREFAFVLDNLVRRVKVAVVQTGSLLSFSITSLVQLTRMGSLAGFLDNSKSLLGIAAGLGLARHFRVPVRTRS